MEKKVSTMKKESLSLKKVSLSAIGQILVTQYGVSREQACQMIKDSGIELIFDRNAEMAAHTSYRTWAQRVYEQFQIQDVAELSPAPAQLAAIAVGRRNAACVKRTSEKRA